MTAPPTAADRLADLARLRRVRDRIDREYAQPLDVEALARGAHMSAGHLSREFSRAYGESPYSLPDDPAHRAGDGAAAPGRPQRHRGVLRRRLLVAGDVQHPVHRAGRRAAERLPTRGSAAPPTGMPSCVAKRVTRPVRNREAPRRRAAPSVTSMDISIHASFLPHDDADAVAGLLPRHRSASSCATTSATTACAGSPSARPSSPDTSIVLHPPGADPGITDDERQHHRRDDGQGHVRHASCSPPPTSTPRSTGCRRRTPRSCRSRPTSRTASATARSATRPAT